MTEVPRRPDDDVLDTSAIGAFGRWPAAPPCPTSRRRWPRSGPADPARQRADRGVSAGAVGDFAAVSAFVAPAHGG